MSNASWRTWPFNQRSEPKVGAKAEKLCAGSMPCIGNLEWRSGWRKRRSRVGREALLAAHVIAQIFSLQAKSTADSYFSSASSRPALLRLAEISSICFGADRMEISIGGITDMCDRQAASAIQQEMPKGKTEARTHGGDDISVLMHGNVVAWRGARNGRAVVLNDRRHQSRLLDPSRVNVRFHAQNEMSELMVVTDLSAAKRTRRIKVQCLRRQVDKNRCGRQRVHEGIAIGRSMPNVDPDIKTGPCKGGRRRRRRS